MIRLMLFALAWFAVAAPTPSSAQTEPRVALVIGNAAYPKGPIRTALGDAGLVAEALRSVGFDVVEGGDLVHNDLRTALREFLARIEAAGPGATTFVYFSGYGLDFEGEAYLVPIDARLERDIDIPLDAIRLSDLMRPLAATKAQARIVVLDAARELPFLIEGGRLSRGIGALEAPPGTLIALSSGPGTFVEDTQGEYSPYAVALVEMVREPGLDLNDMFARIRVRVHQMTQGRQTPWSVAELPPGLTLVPGEPLDARPPSAGAPAAKARVVRRAPRPMRDIGPDEAYGYAIEEDSLPAYAEFVETYPRHPLTPRIYVILRERREAYAWRRARLINSPEAYWTYSRRYPDGIYAPDAERRLRRLSVSLAPPPSFRSIEFEDAPPPLRDEPVRRFDVYPSAPPPPVTLIEPQARYFATLPPPPRPRAPGFLPIPVVIPVAPRVAAPPPRQSVPLTALPQTQPVVAPTQPVIQPAGPDTRPGRPGTPPATATPSPSTTPAAPPAATPPAGSGTPSAATTPPGTTPPAIAQPPSSGRTSPPAVSTAPGAPSPAVASPTPPTAPGQPARPGPTPPGATPPSAATTPTTAPPSTTLGTKPRPSAPPASVTAPPSAPGTPPSAARTSPATPPGSPASIAPAVAKPGAPPAKPNALPRPELPPRTLPSANTRPANPDQRTRPAGPGTPPAVIAPQNAPSTARPTPPASVTRQDPSPPPPSTGARPQGSPSAPPPAASRPAPPPPPATAARPAPPPPPPAAAARPAPPPPPATAARPAPPPAAAARPAAPPPQQPAARAAPAAAPAAAAKPAAKPGEKPKCEIVNGVEVCKR